MYASSLTLSDSTVEGTRSAFDGAGVHLWRGSALLLQRSRVRNCSNGEGASGAGVAGACAAHPALRGAALRPRFPTLFPRAALSLTPHHPSSRNTTNITRHNAGHFSPNVTIVGTTIEANEAQLQAGGLYCWHCFGSVSDTNFTGNSAGAGGAVIVQGAPRPRRYIHSPVFA